jgi:hypothetical protein
MQDPIYQQFISQNPNAQSFIGAIQSHLAEHFAYSYRRQIELKLGVSLPQMGQQLPQDVENDIAKLASVAAERLLSQHNMEQQMAKQDPNDPLTIMQREELRIKEEAVKVKEMQAQADAAYKEGKLEIEAAKLIDQRNRPAPEPFPMRRIK